MVLERKNNFTFTSGLDLALVFLITQQAADM